MTLVVCPFNIKDPVLKFEMCMHHIYTQGRVSQNFYLGPSFYFIESRKLSFKKRPKVSRLFT